MVTGKLIFLVILILLIIFFIYMKFNAPRGPHYKLKSIAFNVDLNVFHETGKIGNHIFSLKTKKTMEEVCALVVERKMSVRELEEYVARLLKPKEVKKAKAKDIFIEEQENILKKRLGTSVTIKQGRNKKGKIEIEFKDNDEFERIISLFKDE